MFTGLVRCLGKITRITEKTTGRQFDIMASEINAQTLVLGGSVAVNGVCLTAVELHAQGFSVDLSSETLERTTLAHLKSGNQVNLEPALSLQDPLGGHLVSGHVDCVGRIAVVTRDVETLGLHIELPQTFMKYVARKGSVCVDGVSLTVNAVTGNAFDVLIIPHTLAHTIVGTYVENTTVNIEVDLIARYVERLLLFGNGPQRTINGITREFLARYGYMPADDNASI